MGSFLRLEAGRLDQCPSASIHSVLPFEGERQIADYPRRNVRPWARVSKEGVSREMCSRRRGVSVAPELGALVVGMLPWRAREPEMLQDDDQDMVILSGRSASDLLHAPVNVGV